MNFNQSLDILFRKARSHNVWFDKPIDDALLHQIYDTMKFGPTSVNCTPVRLFFLKSAEQKAKLKPHLSPGNVNKSMTAPVVTIIAYDTQFYHYLPKLFAHSPDIKANFIKQPDKTRNAARLNATLQAAYLIITARAFGLDCAPMGGFNNDTLDAQFFTDGRHKSLILCGLGYGDISQLKPRLPRLDFNEACQIL